MKNKTLAILFDSKREVVRQNLDALQLILFGLGYRWSFHLNGELLSLGKCDAMAIYIELDTKRLTWETSAGLKANKAYADMKFNGDNLSQVVDFVKNPPPLPKNQITIEEIVGDIADSTLRFVVDVDTKTVDVTITRTDAMNRPLNSSCKVSDEMFKKVFAALGNKPSLPLVSFQYPDSQTNLNRKRLVRLVQVTDDHVRGYELENIADDKGTYKQFSKTRMASDSFRILSFN